MGESGKIKPMKIVLLDDVATLGRRFEVKTVANGYARNLLIPKGLAALADKAMLKRVEILKKQYEQSEKRRQTQVATAINQLADQLITIEVKTNEQGHLFEGIHQTAIAAAIKAETKIELDPNWIKLERPIKIIGDYDLTVEMGETKSQFKLRLIPL